MDVSSIFSRSLSIDLNITKGSDDGAAFFPEKWTIFFVIAIVVRGMTKLLLLYAVRWHRSTCENPVCLGSGCFVIFYAWNKKLHSKELGDGEKFRTNVVRAPKLLLSVNWSFNIREHIHRNVVVSWTCHLFSRFLPFRSSEFSNFEVQAHREFYVCVCVYNWHFVW